MTFQLSPINHRNFVVSDANDDLYEVRYEHFLTNRAMALVDEFTKLEFKPTNPFSTTYTILLNNRKIGEIRYNLLGEIFIEVMGRRGRWDYFTIWVKGIYHNRYDVYHQLDVLLSFFRETLWSKSYYASVIHKTDYQNIPFEILELVGELFLEVKKMDFLS